MSKIIIEKEALMKFFMLLRESIYQLEINMSDDDKNLIDELLTNNFTNFIKLNDMSELEK